MENFKENFKQAFKLLNIDTILNLDVERQKQKQKFGDQPIAHENEFIRIAGEEFGEICKEINQRSSDKQIRKEILQLAAVCIAYLDYDLHDGSKA